MNLRTPIVVLGVLALGLATASRNGAEEKPRAFQLVYQSDTRGYYRPCG